MKTNEYSVSYSPLQARSLRSSSFDGHDLICLSHLRWDFVYQRPQHLLSRFAYDRRVFFVEEPVFDAGSEVNWLEVSLRDENLYVVTPRLEESMRASRELESVLRGMIDSLIVDHNVRDHILWYYTPMAVAWTAHLKPLAIVYDCMDELSAFKGAPRDLLRNREAELLGCADLVFTGGQSLFEAKKDLHQNIFAFPSSIAAPHFAKARVIQNDPPDQAAISHPRLGFFGVVDERMDLELLDAIAQKRPDWQLIIIGPVAKIDAADLPQRVNIHYLGRKAYKELPHYLAGWDVALLPFARNESTRFISPTKTPEYLAAGKPVVSTSITDVVRPYGELNLVRIADTVGDFVSAVESAMVEDHAKRKRDVDSFLMYDSWDRTWSRMKELIEDAISSKSRTAEPVVMKSLAARASASSQSVSSGGD